MSTDRHMRAHTHTHLQRHQMFCHATQANSDKRRQVDATGSHVVNIDISLLCMCSYLFKRLHDHAQMI